MEECCYVSTDNENIFRLVSNDSLDGNFYCKIILLYCLFQFFHIIIFLYIINDFLNSATTIAGCGDPNHAWHFVKVVLIIITVHYNGSARVALPF